MFSQDYTFDFFLSQVQCRFRFSWPFPLFLDYVITAFRGPLIHFLLIAQKLLLLFKLCNTDLTWPIFFLYPRKIECKYHYWILVKHWVLCNKQMLLIFVVEQCSLVLQPTHYNNVLLSQILNPLKLLICDSAVFFNYLLFFIYLVQMFKSRGSAVLLSWLLFMFNTFSDFGTDVFTTNGNQKHNGTDLLMVPGLKCSRERSQKAAGAPNTLHPVPSVGSYFPKASLYPNC